jgi:hypothetical protein
MPRRNVAGSSQGEYHFFPEAALWIHCTQVNQSLSWYHDGLIRNQGNLKKTAHCCGIPHCLSIPIEEILLQLKVCMESVTISLRMVSNTNASICTNVSETHRKVTTT